MKVKRVSELLDTGLGEKNYGGRGSDGTGGIGVMSKRCQCRRRSDRVVIE